MIYCFVLLIIMYYFHMHCGKFGPSLAAKTPLSGNSKKYEDIHALFTWD